MDHTDRLGDTIEKIAYEKAGIIKSGDPVLVGADNNGFETIKRIANEKQSRILTPEHKAELLFENSRNYVCYKDKNMSLLCSGCGRQRI